MRSGPSIDELKALCLKRHDAWSSRVVYRKVSIPVTWVLLRAGVTANQVTWTSALVGLVGILAIVDPTAGRWWVRAAGFLLLQWSIVLDHVDGEVARARGTGSPGGYFLDNFVMEILLHMGLAVALAVAAWQDTAWWPWALVGAAFVLLKALTLSTFLLKGVVSLKYPVPAAAGAASGPEEATTPIRRRVAAYLWEVKKMATVAGGLAVADAVLVAQGRLPVVVFDVPLTLVACFVGLGVAVLAVGLALDVVSASRGQYMTDMEPYR